MLKYSFYTYTQLCFNFYLELSAGDIIATRFFFNLFLRVHFVLFAYYGAFIINFLIIYYVHCEEEKLITNGNT